MRQYSEVDHNFYQLPHASSLREIWQAALDQEQGARTRIKDMQNKILYELCSLYRLNREELIRTAGEIAVAEEENKENDNDEEPEEELKTIYLASGIISYLFGCVLGRWDVRYTTGERASPKLPGPFDPLPSVPLGTLTDEVGLPCVNPPANYRVRIEYGGILVDDPGHQDDAVRRVRDDQVADIEKQIDSGKLSLADLDSLADKGKDISTGVLALIFGSGNPQEVALAFLDSEHYDKEISKKEADKELRYLLNVSFEIELPATDALSKWRTLLPKSGAFAHLNMQ
jgi:hypothetical protein